MRIPAKRGCMEKAMKLSEQIKIMEFPDFGDERGNLVVVESGVDIPFEVKRARSEERRVGKECRL